MNLRTTQTWVAGAVLAITVAGCSAQVEIQNAISSGDGTQLSLSLNSCNRSYRVDVEEADGVMIHVVDNQRRSPIRLGGEDCADRVTVSLSEPLGDRLLIDASSSDAVVVTYEPWNQQRFSVEDFRAALETTATCIMTADPTVTSSVAEGDEGPYLVVNMPDLGDGERDTINAEHHCTMDHLDPLRR